jgi:hypothetical protein
LADAGVFIILIDLYDWFLSFGLRHERSSTTWTLDSFAQEMIGHAQLAAARGATNGNRHADLGGHYKR